MLDVMPETVPVNEGLASGALSANASNTALLEIGLTLPSVMLVSTVTAAVDATVI